MRTRHFKDLLVWQKSMAMARLVYRVTEAFPKHELFGLRSQIRRAAVSVPSNIAEGHGRLSDQLFRTFLAQARGSLYEVETQGMLSRDFGYLSAEALEELMRCCDEIARMINGLLATLERKPSKPNGNAAAIRQLANPLTG